MFLFLVAPCLIVAVQPCIEWIPILKKEEEADRLAKAGVQAARKMISWPVHT